MNPFRKKKKLENGLTWEEMGESFNLFTYERERLRSAQIMQALERDKKRRPQDYIR
jgi:hypothetical protein